jgi:gluconate 2-dehydrogenase gamma chain
MNRRHFLTGATLASFSGAACSRQKSPYRTLSQNEAKTLAALCDQVIPPDQDPGAAWAGAVAFIDIQLTRIYRKHRQVYRDGLARTEAITRERFGGREVSALNADEQLSLMQQLEKEEREFFGLLVAHTMQSYYGSPRHGGNRDYASWRMLGVPLAPARGRQQFDLTNGRVS